MAPLHHAVVTRAFALGDHLHPHPPDHGVKPVHGPNEDMDRARQIIAATQVAELVRNNGLHLGF